jgi:hypothetical protein
MKRLTRGKAITLFCHECCGYDGHRRKKPTISYSTAGYEVSKCEEKKCPLWPFRLGVEITESRPKKKNRDITTMLVKEASKTR